MEQFILIIGWCGVFFASAAALVMIVSSLREQRPAVTVRFCCVFVPLWGMFVGVLLVDFPSREYLLAAIELAAVAVGLSCIVPIGQVTSLETVGDSQRVDERDIPFSRFHRLQPDTPEYEEYYRQYPEKKATDEAIRQLPSLGQAGSRGYHLQSSEYANATFEVLEKLTADLDQPACGPREDFSNVTAGEWTQRIKGFASYLGAVQVGITQFKSEWVYSHIGRSPGQWGEPIELGHSRAIVVAVEMKHAMLRHAPQAPTMTETAVEYFEAAKIATIIARYIQRMGFDARAHVDGNYRVMCVPLAVEAGLGELGRLGLLMTPRLGPRVRLAVITTTMPLICDKPIQFGVQEFCETCLKCADNCPSGSIEKKGKSIFNGVEKWQTDSDSCYRFWRMQGTDCGVCLNVCPYSHPDSLVHNTIRWLIRRNKVVRKLAVLGDDLLYGRRPKCTAPVPDWHGLS